MNDKPNGGPAFPRAEACESWQCRKPSAGMTLRDWFAGQALIALPHMGCGCDLTTGEMAEAAYQVADHMLKARAN